MSVARVIRNIGFDKLDKSVWSKDELKTIRDNSLKGFAKWDHKKFEDLKTNFKAHRLIAQKYRCAYCRRKIDRELGHSEIDHVLSKGIRNFEKFQFYFLNLVITCKRCNNKKNEFNPLKNRARLLKRYPRSESAFVWVHPYFHKYSEHIKKRPDYIYEAIHDSPNGKAVILHCGLNTLEQVESQNRQARVDGVSTFIDALLVTIADEALSDSERVKVLRTRFPKWSEAKLLDAISSVKNGVSQTLEKILV